MRGRTLTEEDIPISLVFGYPLLCEMTLRQLAETLNMTPVQATGYHILIARIETRGGFDPIFDLGTHSLSTT